MFFIKKITALIVTMIVIIPFYVSAETLNFGILEDLPPFQYMENGKPKGIDIEIGNKIADLLGMEFKYKAFPWLRIKNYAQSGKIDGISSMYCMDKYLDIVDFARSPVKSKISVFVQNESSIIVNSLDDLKGKKVGVIRGYTYSDEFSSYKGLRKIECDNDLDLIRRLNGGRIDAAIAEDIPFLYLSKQKGFIDKFKAIYLVVENDLCIAFSKKALGAKSKILADKVTDVFKKLEEDGTVQNIIDSYLK